MYHDITIRPVAMESLRSSCVMGDVSYTMRRMQYGIRSTQYNACCCCNEKDRGRLKAASGGFTLIEIVIVVVIIAIAAMMAIPMMTSAGSFQIRSAANIIAADLEYAKTIAISKGQSFSVVFDITTESYRIDDQSGSIIVHPVKKGFYYAVDFRNDGRLSKVDIENVVFDPGSNSTITFDYLGSPYSGSGTSTPLNSGVISLRVGQMTATINVEPVTGFISIVD
jgi:prepilin-type N-terminal cleavage/methylation domain-containing protein